MPPLGTQPGDDAIPLGRARDWLRDQLNDGAACPCCHQHAQTYFRVINSGMAVGAIRLYRWMQAHPGDYAHFPDLGRRSSEEAKLRYWSLIATPGNAFEADVWRLTILGDAWVRGLTTVPRYVRVYDGKALSPPQSTSRSGKVRPPVSIKDALGAKFDYDALMRGEA